MTLNNLEFRKRCKFRLQRDVSFTSPSRHSVVIEQLIRFFFLNYVFCIIYLFSKLCMNELNPLKDTFVRRPFSSESSGPGLSPARGPLQHVLHPSFLIFLSIFTVSLSNKGKNANKLSYKTHFCLINV